MGVGLSQQEVQREARWLVKQAGALSQGSSDRAWRH